MSGAQHILFHLLFTMAPLTWVHFFPGPAFSSLHFRHSRKENSIWRLPVPISEVPHLLHLPLENPQESSLPSQLGSRAHMEPNNTKAKAEQHLIGWAQVTRSPPQPEQWVMWSERREILQQIKAVVRTPEVPLPSSTSQPTVSPIYSQLSLSLVIAVMLLHWGEEGKWGGGWISLIPKGSRRFRWNVLWPDSYQSTIDHWQDIIG